MCSCSQIKVLEIGAVVASEDLEIISISGMELEVPIKVSNVNTSGIGLVYVQTHPITQMPVICMTVVEGNAQNVTVKLRDANQQVTIIDNDQFKILGGGRPVRRPGGNL